MTLPVFPWELKIPNAAIWYEQGEDGAMTMKIAPVASSAQGPMPLPPAIELHFDPGGWERFKRDVAADGKAPKVPVFGQMPANGDQVMH